MPRSLAVSSRMPVRIAAICAAALLSAASVRGQDDVLPTNGAMLRVLERGDHETRVELNGGLLDVLMIFRAATEVEP